MFIFFVSYFFIIRHTQKQKKHKNVKIKGKDKQHKIRIPKHLEIRLIDFGGATWEDDHHSRIINTRQYRGPEVILDLNWSYPSDLWSIGCIIAELFTGGKKYTSFFLCVSRFFFWCFSFLVFVFIFFLFLETGHEKTQKHLNKLKLETKNTHTQKKKTGKHFVVCVCV